jgi:hypothetical protein
MSENQQFTETIKRESVELQELANGKVVKITASGKLTKASYDFFIPELDNLVEKHGKIRLLFEMIEFQGWTLGAAWEDLKFGCQHFNDIERIAIVGDRRWEKAMVALCRPFTRARIRYFDIDDLHDANDWILEVIY